MRNTISVPEATRAVLVATHTTHTVAQQAEQLGLARTTIHVYRGQLYAEGAIDRTRRKDRPQHTEAERRRAAELARQGGTLREIARAIHRSEADVSDLLRPLGGLHALRAAGEGWRTLAGTAALLGVHVVSVRRWRDAGALVGDRTKAVAQGHWRFSQAAVIAFLRNRRYWMEYTPSLITDNVLRQLATTFRARAGGRWELLARLAGSPAPGTYARWRAHGWPGAGWEVVRSGNADWIWMPAGAAPPDRPARRGQQGVRRTREAGAR